MQVKTETIGFDDNAQLVSEKEGKKLLNRIAEMTKKDRKKYVAENLLNEGKVTPDSIEKLFDLFALSLRKQKKVVVKIKKNRKGSTKKPKGDKS